MVWNTIGLNPVAIELLLGKVNPLEGSFLESHVCAVCQ